jgi:hypothetical protein
MMEKGKGGGLFSACSLHLAVFLRLFWLRCSEWYWIPCKVTFTLLCCSIPSLTFVFFFVLFASSHLHYGGIHINGLPPLTLPSSPFLLCGCAASPS